MAVARHTSGLSWTLHGAYRQYDLIETVRIGCPLWVISGQTIAG
jgi:hypothetical protein